MTREDVVRMAREAGGIDLTTSNAGGVTVWLGTATPEFLERFAKLAAEWGAQQERDRATKICEYAMQMYKDNQNLSPDQSKVGFFSAEFCAAHIKSGESWS